MRLYAAAAVAALMLVAALGFTGQAKADALAPEITVQPTDPNTSGNAVFEFQKAAGDTSDFWYYQCRMYSQPNPPGPNGPWDYCGTDPGTRTFQPQNGFQIFEVRIVQNGGAPEGPIARVEWLQNSPAPTLAPEITTPPANPNALVNASMQFAKAAGETGDITGFQCRRYETGTPPAEPGIGWGTCGTGNTGTFSMPNLPNGSHTAEVRAMNGARPGPVASVTWTQATPLPVQPPVLTTKPQPVQTNATQAVFVIAKGATEPNVVNRFQCRTYKGSTPPAWATCTATNHKPTPGNGEYTTEVRAGNAGGYGPVTTFHGEINFPNPGVSVDAESAASARWHGGAANSRLAPLGLLSPPMIRVTDDVNGDGNKDVLAMSDSEAFLNVLFTAGGSGGSLSINELRPSDGYRIKTGVEFGSTFGDVGDQNGDGIADTIIRNAEGSAVVVYGVSDPTSLPLCAAGSRSRCVDVANLGPDEGYEFTNPANLSQDVGGAGDFDGDGTDDFYFSDPGADTWVVKGKPRTGTVDLTSLPVDERIIFETTDTFMGPTAMDDLNGDGREELYGGSNPLGGEGGMYLLYGQAFSSANEDPIQIVPTPSDLGLRLYTPAAAIPGLDNIGDVNGDGRPDLAMSDVSLGPALSGGALGGQVSVIYTPELPTDDGIVGGDDLPPGGGYMINGAGTETGIGFTLKAAGDVNGDGLGDTIAAAPGSPWNGIGQGAAYLFFSHNEVPADPIQIGGALTPENGIAIAMRADGAAGLGNGFGANVLSVGDVDNDGIPDQVATFPAAAYNGMANAGAIYLIPGKSIFAQANTGGTSDVADGSATLRGQVGTGKRDVEVKFEYGKTDAYGSQTGTQELEGSNGMNSVQLPVTGLDAATEYHYRMVVENDLGMVRYGDDRTFTTAAKPAPTGCEADATLPGCSQYDYCKANPTKPECKAPEGKLSKLIVSSAASKVKRGKSTKVTASIVSTGTADVAGLKICMTAPKKLVKGAKCVTVGGLASGQASSKTFTVKVNKKAKKGKTATLKLTATANGLSGQTGAVKIKVG